MVDDSFVLMGTYHEQIKLLPEDMQLKFFIAINEYGLYEIEPEFTGIEAALFLPIKNGIDRSKEKRRAFLEKQANNGRIGGRPNKPTETQKTQAFSEKPTETQKTQAFSEKPTETQKTQAFFEKPTETQKSLNVNVNVNENENVNENVNVNENTHTLPSSGTSPPGAMSETKECKFLDTYFIKLWQQAGQYVNSLAHLERPKDYLNYWQHSKMTVDEVKACFNAFLEDVKNRTLEKRFIPATPDRFILKGWLERYWQAPEIPKNIVGEEKDFPDVCPNCGKPLVQRYCENCGVYIYYDHEISSWKHERALEEV